MKGITDFSIYHVYPETTIVIVVSGLPNSTEDIIGNKYTKFKKDRKNFNFLYWLQIMFISNK